MKDKKVVLLTGASAGLGLATAKLLMKHDYFLVLSARESSLYRFKENSIVESTNLWIRTMDVTNTKERKALIHEINDKLGGVDVLINNAGVAYRSVVEHVTEHERIEQLNINFFSVMELTRLVLPSMRAKRQGKIINISSVSGMMAMPTMSIYSASKFALEGASEALWYEVKPWNIKISLIQPGFIHSNSFQKTHSTFLGKEAIEDINNPYHAHYSNMNGFIEKMMTKTTCTPDKVAKIIHKTIKRNNPPLRIAGTLDAYLFYILRRLSPRNLYHQLLYRSLPQIKLWGKK
jgi:short-subunit dehydrogenase